MSQIYYNIVSLLLKKDIHIRRIAKLLGTNQTTIARKVQDLEAKNILDFVMEGKNKVYFVKPSIESEEYIKIIEYNKLINLISKHSRFRNIVKTIKNNKKIQLAILFGSYAKNTQTKESDIDIYIETTSVSIKKRIELLDSNLSIQTGTFNKDNLLVQEIMKNHIILKGVEKYYELIHQKNSAGGKNKTSRT